MENAAIPGLAGLRILVVEDEFMIAEHICTMLEDFGCSIAGPVGTIPQALEAVRETGLDGVLLDANLHGQSSLPIALVLKAASVPFVVATGYGGIALGGEALQEVPRISKPFSERELKEMLLAAFAKPLSGQAA